jgi:hypothetical protein
VSAATAVDRYQAALAVLRERLAGEALTAVRRELARQRREVARRAAQGATLRGAAAAVVITRIW